MTFPNFSPTKSSNRNEFICFGQIFLFFLLIICIFPFVIIVFSVSLIIFFLFRFGECQNLVYTTPNITSRLLPAYKKRGYNGVITGWLLCGYRVIPSMSRYSNALITSITTCKIHTFYAAISVPNSSSQYFTWKICHFHPQHQAGDSQKSPAKRIGFVHPMKSLTGLLSHLLPL